MTKATREVWAERVRAWRASGLDAEAFAAGKGYAGVTLTQRARELGRDGPERVRLRRVVRTPTPSPASLRSAAAPSASASVLLRIGGAELVVGPGFDAALVRSIVRCLREVAS